MKSKVGKVVLVVCLSAFHIASYGCASDTPERRQPRSVPQSSDSAGGKVYPQSTQESDPSFDVECSFGISGCESQASEACGYAGFHVIGSYRTQGAFGTPYFYMKAACGPAQAVAGPPVAANAAHVPSPAPSPAKDRRESGHGSAFDVECRFGISGCESQASEQCGYAGYHVLGSYQTQGAFGTPYFYMKAACGPAPNAKPPTSTGAVPISSFAESRPAGSSGTPNEGVPATWDNLRLEMAPVSATSPRSEGKGQADPFDKPAGPDAERAESLESRARGGNPEAQTKLGARYNLGDGVPKNPGRAMEWYQRAAEQGDATAQNNLAVFYDRGEVVPRDLAKAAYWYRKAADQGAPIAQYNLAVVYRLGFGLPKDDNQAANWFTAAAVQGQANAQALLGILYLRGEGVAKDNVLAYAWLNLAAAQGYDVAARARDEMRLPPEALAEAQRLSSSWKKGQVLRRPGAEKKERARTR